VPYYDSKLLKKCQVKLSQLHLRTGKAGLPESAYQ
jgi:hypothetical protein